MKTHWYLCAAWLFTLMSLFINFLKCFISMGRVCMSAVSFHLCGGSRDRIPTIRPPSPAEPSCWPLVSKPYREVGGLSRILMHVTNKYSLFYFFTSFYFDSVPRMFSTTLVCMREDIFISFLIFSSSYSLPFLPKTDLHWAWSSLIQPCRGWPLSFSDPPVSNPSHLIPALGFLHHRLFYVGFGDMSSGPHACTPNFLMWVFRLETCFSVHSMWNVPESSTACAFIFMCSKYFLVSRLISS